MKNLENTSNTALAIELVINAWANQNQIITAFFSKYDDDYYLNSVAPERNRGIYLLGHLIVANDNLIPLLGFGDKLFPQLEEIFWFNPDKKIEVIPSISELKANWEKLNEFLKVHFTAMETGQWFERHTKVAEEDFLLDKKRNKLNAFLGRVTHQNYHIGQLALFQKKEVAD